MSVQPVPLLSLLQNWKSDSADRKLPAQGLTVAKREELEFTP